MLGRPTGKVQLEAMADSDSNSSTLTDLSSELSSAPASPKLPPLSMASYPTPSSSQTQSTYSSSSEQDSRKRRRKDAECPPMKRRKIVEPRERKVERLDLQPGSPETLLAQSLQLEILLKAIHKKRKIVVVAGAGISTSAGVPDFRSSNGLFNTLRGDSKLKASGKQLFDASVYQTDASTSSFHDMVRTLSSVVNGAEATAFHHLLATLAHEGRLLRLYSQNVDGIDVELEPLRTEIPLPKKGPWPRTVQLHGSLKKMVCVKCGDLKDFDSTLFDGPSPPSCGSCFDLDKVRTEEAGKRSHGIGKLRPRMVLYNEHNPDAEAIGTIMTADLRARPDALIVVGTSMEIPGVQRMVREMCAVIRGRRDGKCIWVNRNPPPTGPKYEACWDLVVAGDCDQVARLADMRKWYEEPREGVRVSESDAERAKSKDGVLKVVVQSPKKNPAPPGLLTPAPSPKLEATRKTGLKIKFPAYVLKNEEVKLKNSALKAPSKPSKETSKAHAKSNITKAVKPNASKEASAAKIKKAFKVTKVHAPIVRKMSITEEAKPFEPIPPQSARSNSAPYDVMLKDVIHNTGRLKQMSEERVSPTGGGPKDMAHILN